MESLLEGLKINFCQVIANELFTKEHNMASLLPCLCLIRELCKMEKIPIISRVDNEVRASKSHDIE